MKDLKDSFDVRINKDILHQGIGGKILRVEKEGTIKDVLDWNFDEMPIALQQFIMRRNDWMDFDLKEDLKIYYGHLYVNNLGYFIAEDEIDEYL